MELTFLGSGHAFSSHSYNACIMVDRRLLLDAGAPLCVHLPRVGVGLGELHAVFLTHFHADHTFGLAALVAARTVEVIDSPPLTVLGPPGSTDYVRRLLDFAWGDELRRMAWERLRLRVLELSDRQPFEVDGYRGTAFSMIHSSHTPALGFALERDGVRLGYTGDAELCPGVDALVNWCDHLVSEMTYEQPGSMHLSRPEVEKLMAEHPGVRFILTHRATDSAVSGAVMARDFLTLQLPLP